MRCALKKSVGPHNIRDTSDGSKSIVAPIMQFKKIIVGNSWKMRKLEVFGCNTCNFEYTFPRYGEILRTAETKT